VVPTGLEYGTVTVLVDGRPVEVTTYRKEGLYRDRRRPSTVVFTTRLEDDLGRRDFTVNAMALDGSWNLIDPFGGLRDLMAGRIRAVGDPDRRFGEDALRMVRALRLAAELSFHLDPDTRQALYRHMPEIRHVAVERVFAEWQRLLRGNVGAVAGELAESGFLHWWMGLPEKGEEVVPRWAAVCARLPHCPAMRTAALCRLAGVDRVQVLSLGKRWRADRKFCRDLAGWWEASEFDPLRASGAEWARWLYRTGRERCRQGFLLAVAVHGYEGEQEAACRDSFRYAVERQPMWDRRDLAVPPAELGRAAGVKTGPEWGAFYQDLTEAVLEGRVANRETALRAFAETWIRSRGTRGDSP
ncbi:MAG: hypothetical protein IRY98_03865, partial [Alicyclobacillaceae bacterium]|nr:hypothetical protein [Alicyclobacillaceae bacterium]